MTAFPPLATKPTALEKLNKYSLKSQAVMLGRALAKRTAMDVANAKKPAAIVDAAKWLVRSRLGRSALLPSRAASGLP